MNTITRNLAYAVMLAGLTLMAQDGALMPVPKHQFFDANGRPLGGGKIYTYAAGTSTPLATYTDATRTAANTNPVVLDSAGRANIWLAPQAYKIVAQNALGVQQWSVDNVSDIGQVLRRDLADPAYGGRLVAYQSSGAGAVPRTAHDKLADTVDVRDFGAKCDGETDDQAAISAALAYATSTKQHLRFPPGRCLVSQGRFDVDMMRTGLIGQATEIKLASATGSYLVRVFSEGTYWQYSQNRRNVLDGIHLIGGAIDSPYAGTTGLVVGNSVTQDATADFTISNLVIHGFEYAFVHGTQSYSYSVEKFLIRNGKIRYPSGAGYGHERVFWRDGRYCDGENAIFELNAGDVFFESVSFDNSTVRCNGEGSINIIGGHLENPGNQGNGYRMVEVLHPSCTVRVKDTVLVLNPPPTGTWNTPIFYVADNVYHDYGGLEIDGLRAFQHTYYTPDVTVDHRVLVGGAGRVVARNIISWTASYQWYALSRFTNLIRNGDFESDLSYWQRELGTSCTTEIVTSGARHGSKALKVSCPMGTKARLWQRFDVSPGNMMSHLGYYKVSSSAGNANVQLRFYDKYGVEISSGGGGYTVLSQASDWTLKSGGVWVPVGAQFAVLDYWLQGLTGLVDVYIDDVIVSQF